MLTKHVQLEDPINDNIRRLGNYIADASHKGEKCLESWSVGCLSPNYQSSIFEIEATQALNKRTTKEKTYHLVISFRAGDEHKITPEMYKKIEEKIAKSLGFENHQRLCGIHQNTNNIHMHIAYNMIDPIKYNRHEPYRDQVKLRNTAKKICEEYGLSFDKKKEKDREGKITQRAAAMEAHSGQQSFQSFALECKQKILSGIKLANNWNDIHIIFANFGMQITPRGNGLVVIDEKGNGAIKASALDRSLSKAKLTKKFGNFKGKKNTNKESHFIKKYSRRVLHQQSKERDQLYRKYSFLLNKKKIKIKTIQEEQKKAMSDIYSRYQKISKKIFKESYDKQEAYSRIFALKKILNKQISDTKKIHREQLKTIKDKTPFYNWNGFLKNEALNGNTQAFKVLQRKNENNSIRIMRLLKEQDRKRKESIIPLFKERIDNNGNIIYQFNNGGVIRDCGDKLFFSKNKKDTERVALIYALTKFSKNIQFRENSIEPNKKTKNKYNQPSSAIIRDITTRNGMRTLSKLNVASRRSKEKASLLLHDNAQYDMER